jgi:uncharacterized protein (DUF2062 family)
MPRRLIKRFLPDHHTIRDHKHLRFLGKLLHDPNILHLNRRSVSGAFAVGLFMAFIPVPFQMIFAAIGAIAFRVNLPISVVLVWLTNPLTMVPVYYAAYKIGALVLQSPVQALHFEWTREWLVNELGAVWEPFLLGSLILSTGSAILGYALTRVAWRVYVNRSWSRRKFRRLEKDDTKKVL